MLTKLMSGQVYAKQKALWGLHMLVRGTDLKKATLAVAVMMVAASLQGMASVQDGEEASKAGFFCSEEGVCRVSNTSTVMVLAQSIETVVNNADIAVQQSRSGNWPGISFDGCTNGCGEEKWWLFP